jgi:hypothetical protein
MNLQFNITDYSVGIAHVQIFLEYGSTIFSNLSKYLLLYTEVSHYSTFQAPHSALIIMVKGTVSRDF